MLLWIDDQLIINQWYDQPAYMEYTASATPVPNMHFETVKLSAGPHRIKLEYYEHGKNAALKLGWTPVKLAPTRPSSVDPCSTTLTEDTVHLVRPGDWLYKIARAYNVSVQVIIEANGLTSTKVSTGQTLIIPGAATCSAKTAAPAAPVEKGCQSTYTVKPGDNLFRISLRFDVSVAVMAAQNGMSAPYTVHVGQVLCVP